ncbi:TetR/AcrR family transcriptional regulator [Leifsonia sp. F6_8S_P_1B]|uniref:TetR/AcrR family transcriptional regulator n=1 Tax=Leifsonia williamsii TaxID=3035919 RepID=A0ABT8KCX2_9MICO|nr:TetR/AcrR family transcriptional regulator [Leifsonia williamsii]MDN4615296.1 TetR/AcrR family transcriptional regulator [Leifsonia williamsii]
MARRGAYAKGVAKREEILEAALDVIAREGWHGASVKELADAVGLSQAGLLHYFDSKDELFTAILRKRDEVDSRRFGEVTGTESLPAVREGFVGIVRHNAQVPGLVQLFSRLAVEAGDPSHPAHDYFVERSAALRDMFTQALAGEQEAGRVSPVVDPETLARLVQAVSDGMQLQWLQDPTVDMAATVDAAFTLLGMVGPAGIEPTTSTV